MGNVSFDARQGRTKILLVWLNELLAAQAENNYNKWLKCLYSIYYACQPYVKEKDAATIKKLLLEAEEGVNTFSTNTSRVDYRFAKKKLDNLTEQSLRTFRDQFMTMNSEEDDEWNPDDFEK